MQPAYFDAGPPADAAAAEAPIEIPADIPRHQEASPSTDQQDSAQTSSSSDSAPTGPKRRRRRGRGGRGRNRSAASVPATSEATAQAAAPEEAVTPVAAAAAPASTKAPKGTVVLAIGLPGSGKSSWFKRHNITPLSSDLLRSLLFDDPTEQRFQDLVFSNLRSMLKARLIARRPMNYVDATNLTSHDRHSWIKLAKDFGYEVHAVFFDVPLDVCLERNRKRERVVGEDVLRRLASKMKQPTFEEGFAKITVVRVKPKQGGSGAEPSS